MTPVDKAFLDDVLALCRQDKLKYEIQQEYVMFDIAASKKVFIQKSNISRYNHAFSKTSYLPRERFVEEAVNYIKGIIADVENEDDTDETDD